MEAAVAPGQSSGYPLGCDYQLGVAVMAHQTSEQYIPKPRVAFTQERMEQFLELYSKSGRKAESAEMCGVGCSVVSEREKTDKAWAAAVAEAHAQFVSRLEKAAFKRAVKGVKKPIVGRVGKDEDGIITYEVVYSDKMLTELLRRHSPDYRQSNIPAPSVAVTQVGGGVLILPGSTPPDPAAWEQQFSTLAQGRTYMPQDAKDEESRGRSE